MLQVKKLNHIQICIPFGKEPEARDFYTHILGFKEIPKPIELLKNGCLWYEVADIQFHIGCEEVENKSKRHPAFEVENILECRNYFLEKNILIKEETRIPHCERFSILDPFNNRIEFLEKIKNIPVNIQLFWKDFIFKNPKYKDYSIPKSDSFCNDEITTNKIVKLVEKGIKTATCSALIEYKIEKEELPKVGDLSIIVDWEQNPICVIKITDVIIRKFNHIDESFAKKEGEGDLSLAYWRSAHRIFFTSVLKDYCIGFSEEMELVCEEFVKL